MPASAPKLEFNTQFTPQVGVPEQIVPYVRRIVAPNASAYTFTGTNTYLIGTNDCFIIDPGPDDAAHLQAVLGALEGARVEAILLTHTHLDHCALARRLADETGAPVWFGGPHRLSRPKRPLEVNLLSGSCDWALRPDLTLTDGTQISAGTFTLDVMATPGHCANHLAYGLRDTPFLFSGDHVMGWNSTLVATPDGSMRDYFASLDRLIAAEWSHYLPGHGDTITHAGEYARALKAHRQMRNSQIVDAVSAGAQSINAIVDILYPDVGKAIRRAAAMTVEAHLEYLAELDQVDLKYSLGRGRVMPIR